VLCGAVPGTASAQITTAVRNGDPILGGGSELRKFRAGVVSDASGQRLAFRATARDAVGGHKGILRAAPNGLGVVIAESKASAPTTSTYRNFRQPAINAARDVAWFAFLSDGRRGIYRTVAADPNIVREAAVVGAQAPLSPGTFFYSDLGEPEITDSGVVAFWGAAGTAEGIFACGGGNSDCVTGTGLDWALARTGSSAGGRQICGFEQVVRASDFGVVFRASTRTNCANTSETLREAIFRADFADVLGLQLIALAGNPTDLGPGITYQRFRDAPTISNSGAVVFHAAAAPGTVSEALFFCSPSANCPNVSLPVSVVDKGQVVSGNELRRFSGPQIADNGDIVFQARPRGGTAVGRTLYVRRSGGAIQLIVTTQQAVNDTPGATFKRVGGHHSSPGGTVVFRASVSGAPWRTGLFLWQP
jgi:hypothetical protein